MRQISFQTKIEALELYLQGFPTNEIVTKTGISKGAVISILKDAREGNFPGLELKDRIDELHNLSVRLRKEGLDLSQARLGFSFFERLLDMDIEPGKVKEWIDFCSEISPTPPESFIPAAMELLQVGKETGLSYTELASQVRELAEERQRLIDIIGDLKAKERKHSELKTEIDENERRVSELRAKRSRLEADVASLNSFIQKRAEVLEIPYDELEAKLGELINLDDEIATRCSEHNRLQGEVEALSGRHEKLSSQMEKASADLEHDIKLIRQVRQEVAGIAEMKGRYEKEVENMEWAKRVLPFLSDPDKVQDDDFSLVSIVVNCLDKWIQTQPEWRFRLYSVNWDDVKRLVQSKRAERG